MASDSEISSKLFKGVAASRFPEMSLTEEMAALRKEMSDLKHILEFLIMAAVEDAGLLEDEPGEMPHLFPPNRFEGAN